MNIADFKRLLNSRGLKATSSRLRMFAVLSAHDNAINQADIELAMKTHADRATFYRTLRAFERYGIIHRIVSGNGVPNFALSLHSSIQNGKDGSIQHLHFNCIICGNLYCLTDASLPKITLPDDYKVYSLDMVMAGVCSICNHKG
jgi:Fur family ferric uptake transcriptional regulator